MVPIRTCLVLCLSAAAAGCAGGPTSTHTGRRILADLERAGIPLPDSSDPSSKTDPAGVPYAAATPPSHGPIRLRDLWAAAEAASPDLAAARSRVGSAAGQSLQASRYPNPAIDVQSEEIPLNGGGFSEAKTTVGFTQPIILGDRRSAATTAAEAEQSAAMARLEVRRREILAEVALLYSRLVTVREAQRLNTELHGLAGRTLAIAQTRFEARSALETEVIRPRVEIDRLEIGAARLARERRAAADQLRLLLGGVEVDGDRLDEGQAEALTALDLDALRQSLREFHPALAAADREIDAAAARLERVDAERTPDLDVRVAAGYRGETDGAIVEVGAGLEIPLWDGREGDLLSARFDLMRARQERHGAENSLLARLGAAHADYETAREEWAATRERIVPAMQRAFDQTTEAYRAGRAPFLELLEAQRSLADARLSLLEAAGSAGAARARLIEILGPEFFGASSPGSFTTPERPMGAEVPP